MQTMQHHVMWHGMAAFVLWS